MTNDDQGQDEIAGDGDIESQAIEKGAEKLAGGCGFGAEMVAEDEAGAGKLEDDDDDENQGGEEDRLAREPAASGLYGR